MPPLPSDPRQGLPRVAILTATSLRETDGIRDYSSRITIELGKAGASSVLVEFPGWQGGSARRRVKLLCAAWGRCRGSDAVVVQYNPFSFGLWGIAPWLPAFMFALRLRGSTVVTMLHEAAFHGTDRRGRVIEAWQLLQLRAITQASHLLLVTIDAWRERVAPTARPVVRLPVASNLPDMRSSRASTRDELGIGNAIALVAFGSGHPGHETRLLERALACVAAVRPTVLLNLGGGALSVPSANSQLRVVTPGFLPAADVARYMAAGDIFLGPYKDGASTRRTTLMAALQHGVAVVSTTGGATDPDLRSSSCLVLTDPADFDGFGRAAASLAAHDLDRRSRGDAGRELYQQHYDWPVLVEKLLCALPASRA